MDLLHQGLMALMNNTNIILTGGVDDILDIKTGELIVADYKSQANFKPLIQNYLSDVYHEGYNQMDFYALLKKMDSLGLLHILFAMQTE